MNLGNRGRLYFDIVVMKHHKNLVIIFRLISYFEGSPETTCQASALKSRKVSIRTHDLSLACEARLMLPRGLFSRLSAK